MNNYQKTVEKLNKINNIEQQRDKKLYSNNIIMYYSPFVDEKEQFEKYSMHAIYIIEKSNSIEEGIIGYVISPDEPYYLVENDILIEFSYNKINIFKAEMKNNVLKLVQKVKNSEDNIFLATYLIAQLNTGNY